MTNLNESRRRFLKGCAATAAVGAVGPGLFFSSSAEAANGYDTIVYVFLRGGMDGLNFIVPVDGADRTYYEEARPSLQIATSGAYGALPLTLADSKATGFGMHPSATGLRDIWNSGKLAVVHACGLLTTVTRSHFDAQLTVDLGVPAEGQNTGWIARAMASQSGLSGVTMPALAAASRTPSSFNGASTAISMSSSTDFAVDSTAWQWKQTGGGRPSTLSGARELLPSLWGGSTGLETAGDWANDALKVVAQQSYASRPADWPTTTFANQLWTIAQSIQFNLGLRFATVDLGGWDTHESQGTAGSGYNYYQNKIAELSQGLSSFYASLSASGHLSRVTVVVQSEFGRRVRQNGSGGTDHGYGNPVLVLGGPVNGRKFYGTWPGLDPEVLSEVYGDIPVKTDHRRVLSELLIRRMANANLSTVFPGYSGYSPLGIVQGSDLAVKSLPLATSAASIVSADAAADGTGWHHLPTAEAAIR